MQRNPRHALHGARSATATHVSTIGGLLGREKQLRRWQTAYGRFSVSAVYSSDDAAGDDAALAGLQSQEEAYLLSPLGSLSGVDSVSLQSVDDFEMDAGEWQKDLLGRIGRFAGARDTRFRVVHSASAKASKAAE